MCTDHVLSCEKQECVWMSWVLRDFFFIFKLSINVNYWFTDVPISEKDIKMCKSHFVLFILILESIVLHRLLTPNYWTHLAINFLVKMLNLFWTLLLTWKYVFSPS